MVGGRWVDDGQWTTFQRCLICGDLTDHVIRYNQLHPPHEPGGQARHRAYDPERVWQRWLSSRRPIATPPEPDSTSTDRRA
jgi:hypothetical protein